MSTWTATNIQILKTLVDVADPKLVSGNKAIFISFTSDILKDGVLDHNYNENNVGVPADGDFTALVTRIVRNHLAAFALADAVSITKTPVPDVALPPPPVPPDPPTAKQSALQEFQQS